MGTCYIVSAELRFRDGTGEGFCKAVCGKLDELVAAGWARVDYGDADRDDPFEVFDVVCPGVECHGDAWYAGFDASYGWETVMYECFTDAAPSLAPGSCIEVWGEEHWKVEA